MRSNIWYDHDRQAGNNRWKSSQVYFRYKASQITQNMQGLWKISRD